MHKFHIPGLTLLLPLQLQYTAIASPIANPIAISTNTPSRVPRLIDSEESGQKNSQNKP